MNAENEKKLLTDFPKLYRQYYLPMTETAMMWGWECDDGWFDLIYELSKKITELDPKAEAVQVKEKFGGLRFYITTFSDAVTDLIDVYEEKSNRICMKCGSTDNVTKTSGWIVTLCEKCMKEYKKERGIT